jgi:hypothetical protein
MDERIEAFLKDVLRLEGADANTVREGVRAFLAVYEVSARSHYHLATAVKTNLRLRLSSASALLGHTAR